MIELLIKSIFIVTLFLILLFYGILLFATERAHRDTGLPIPFRWRVLITINLILTLVFMGVIALFHSSFTA